jgi:hypothetical protein
MQSEFGACILVARGITADESVTLFIISLQIRACLERKHRQMTMRHWQRQRQKRYRNIEFFQDYVATVLISYIHGLRFNSEFASKGAIL